MTPPSWTDQLEAWSTLATAVLTFFLLVAAGLAWGAAKATLDAATRANEQAQRDSIEQTRPYVYAEVTPSLAGVGHWDLKVTNVGKSSARRLTLAYDAWPPELDDISSQLRDMFQTPRTLPPGCSIRAYWRLTGTATDGTADPGLGEAGTISVSYTSDDAERPRYEDVFDVMIQHSGLAPVGESGPEPEPGVMDARERAFYRLGQATARHLAALRR